MDTPPLVTENEASRIWWLAETTEAPFRTLLDGAVRQAIAAELRRLAVQILAGDPGDALSEGWSSRYARQLYERAAVLNPDGPACTHERSATETIGRGPGAVTWTSCLTCGAGTNGEWSR